MTKKLLLSLGCLALVLSLVGVARADDITFSVVSGAKNGLTANPSGFISGNGTLVLVSDTDTSNTFPISGTASVTTGPATSYTTSGTGKGLTLNATYADGSGVDVTVFSSKCPGGICLQGEENGGGYSATTGTTGSFQGQFIVTYVNPYIPELFGDPTAWLPDGSDSLDSGMNSFTLTSGKITGDKGTLTGGTITYETPVPEPGSLALFGSGLLGLAGVLRRKLVR
jgi:hypothetical protein